MVQRVKTWYPFLFALLPILNTLNRNPGGTRLEDAAVVMGVAVAGCAVVYLLGVALFRGKRTAELVPLIVLVVILLFYGKSAIGILARRSLGAPPAVMLGLLLILAAVLLWWLSRRPGLLDRVNTFFGLTGMLLVAWLGIRVVTGYVESQSVVRNSQLAEELRRPIRFTEPASPGKTKQLRDIYLLVLDEYANSAVLREQFQFDNRPFEDSLRQLGFTIPELVRSNYVHTLLSLPSLLNFTHLTKLTDEVGTHSTDATLPNYLLENNRTADFLQARGYQFLFFPSQWWPSTRRNRNADWTFEPWSGFNIEREATRSDLRRSLVSRTALDLFHPGFEWDADHVRRTLSALEQVPRRAEPTFAFAHLVSPHWPYVFEADCRVARQGTLTGKDARRGAYTGQLQCLNRILLRTVRTILERSSPAPIILLQGDHGTNLLRYSAARSAAAVTPEQARERFGAFGAYYLPGGGDRLFADTVTVVNVFQKVLKYYFGADVAAAPDDLYVSLERTPYLFAKVDPTSLRP